MAQALSYTNAGPTPQQPLTMAAFPTSSTPASMALNKSPNPNLSRALSGYKVGSSGNLTATPPMPPSGASSAPAAPSVPTTGTYTQAPVAGKTPGYTYTNGILTDVGGKPTASITPPAPPTAPEAPKPITGITTTPSGAQVDTATGKLVTPPPGASTAPQFGSTVSGIINAAQGAAPIGEEAQKIAADYGKQIAQVGQQGALAKEGLMTTGGPSAPLVGNALAQAQLAAEREQALAAGESAALQGTGQQLTAQKQEQQGLGTAGGLIQPTASYPFVFNPATGEFSTAGGTAGGGAIGLTRNPATDIPAAVQAIQANPALYNSYASAIDAGYGTNGSVIKSQLDAALLKAGLNPTNLAAQSTAQAQNISTAGTAETSIAAAGLSDATQTYQKMTGFANAAQQQAQQVSSILQATGLNSGIPDWNSAINSLSSKFGATNITALTTAITELQNMYSQVLSSRGTTPTGSEQQALALLNPSSSAAQISESIDQLNTAMYNSLQAQYGVMQDYQKNLSGAPAASPSTTGSSNQTYAGAAWQ